MSSATGLPALDNTMGALYIGIVLAMGLWGAGTVQLYYYLNSYPEDRWQLKLLVFFVWALDTVHQGLISQAGYMYMVKNFANPLFLNDIVQSLEVMVIISALVVILVQMFLIYRVWMLSERNHYIAAFLVVLSLAEFGATVAYYVRGSALSHFTEVGAQLGWLSRLVNALGAVTDTCIALALCTLLRRARTGLRRSDTLITRLIVFTLTSGLATGVLAVLAFAFVTRFPDNLIYVVVYFMISRTYTNTLLATLNRRQSSRSVLDSSEYTVSRSAGGIAFSHTRGNTHNMNVETSPPGITQQFTIKVETETQHDIDDSPTKSYPLTPIRTNELSYEQGNMHMDADESRIANAV